MIDKQKQKLTELLELFEKQRPELLELEEGFWEVAGVVRSGKTLPEPVIPEEREAFGVSAVIECVDDAIKELKKLLGKD